MARLPILIHILLLTSADSRSDTCLTDGCSVALDEVYLMQLSLHKSQMTYGEETAEVGKQHPVPGNPDQLLAACEELWNGNAVSGVDPGGHQCEPHSMVPSPPDVFGGSTAPVICTRQYPDGVSDQVKSQGFWQDCPVLSSLWTSLSEIPPAAGIQQEEAPQSFSLCAGRTSPTKKLFVDIGANIGSCTMQMLARPDVGQVVAFEPNPENLFYLTSSALMNQGFPAKLALYPIGLGNVDANHTMFEEKGNIGNSVMDVPVQASNAPAHTVKTRTLDEIFMADGSPPYIHLMKIDTQGFEVNILKGGSKLLKSGAIRAMKLEVAKAWLYGQKTNTLELFNVLGSSGYVLHDFDAMNTLQPMSVERLKELSCPGREEKAPPVYDIAALYDPLHAVTAVPCN